MVSLWFVAVLALLAGLWYATERDDDVLVDDSGRFDVLLERAGRELPTVCRRCDVVRGWKALALWSPAYLADKAEQPLLVSVQRRRADGGEQGGFVYQRDSSLLDDLAAVADFRAQTLPEQSRVPLDGRDFFARLARIEALERNNESYVADELIYYGGGLESFPTLARTDVFPVNASLWLSEHRRDNPLWIGHRSVAVGAHFDYCLNAFVQIYGDKTFCLLAPERHHYTFPFAHPGYRQSSHDYHLRSRSLASPLARALDAAKNASSAALQRLMHCVTLSPGDVLYVPPFWWHTVRAESVSISLSFFSERPQLAEDELTALPIPFADDWRDADARTALAVYVGSYWPDVLDYAVRYRYVPAFGHVDSCRRADVERVCPPALVERFTLPRLVADFRRGRDLVAATLERHRLQPTARRILLATYVDKLIAYFVDQPDVNFFAQCCTLERILYPN